ncbi:MULTISPECIES: LysR family transcriptional regulator [Caballeronia]|jgi:DNA-binding transcriptional LysR family regulator|uniref:LysR family transcriptional regulator n=1 Tax=Caballeronia zhejiangensis TaxID=871203 RepID=A0A656QCS8_9BURK|nr:MULTISPECIES: LysR family transcriptional regulator [Caballeronia]EKS69590.1 LysR family transcriptional regulator [Burkholderia sp. SJ98]KDR27088.1 LysR family transcriptional regulator [Caballeronia zhejiangensis]MCG7400994.1 LysR family transcriptional regulator [Caballeronia zhejiangensis]MCI1046350.1 LysR family transcriptional regulator [Caballeronia zhejiangensis]MDR5791268.1 LysR family transcriptional regulator [Caballeronia sp. LP003]
MGTDSELGFFCLLVKQGSLAATARELNLTPPAVSRRLSSLEDRLGVRLLNRTTRRISLTSEGEVYFANAQRILSDIDDMERTVSSSRAAPKGLLRVNAPLGFGRSYIGPAISEFSEAFPDVEVQLHLTDRPISLPDESIDVSVRFGEMPDSRLIAKKIASNRRLLVSSPGYLRVAGEPAHPHDLTSHQCIVLRQNEAAYGNWRLTRSGRTETVKVHGKLSTNDGEVALNWALEGRGILMRAEWDVAKYLRSGRLVQVLSEYDTPPADIYAVYPERLNLSPKVAVFVDHLRHYLGQHADGPSPAGSPW